MIELTFEASELRWPPGHWPETFENGNYFFDLVYVTHKNGEIFSAMYVDSVAGVMATVFND
jgi:hypothetical protein